MSTTTFALTFLLIAENLVIIAMGFQRFDEGDRSPYDS